MIVAIAAGQVKQMHDELYNPQFSTGKAHLSKDTNILYNAAGSPVQSVINQALL